MSDLLGINQTILKDISTEEFFAKYWQQKPLLIKGAFANKKQLTALISPEEIAGYSLEPEIESRLIQHNTSLTQWELKHGPFDESLFEQLSESNWTLLVQSLDSFHPPLLQLIKACNFIPRWRLDDVMVSFATDQAGVGPHLDKYDVFLIQGLGKRRWRVGHKNQSVSHFSPHPDLKQIEHFEAQLDIEVTTGDMLYIPPNTPHWGTSIDDSICYSVGFRAPTLDTILQQLLETNPKALNSLWEDKKVLSSTSKSGLLPAQLIDWTQEQTEQLFNSKALAIAIGQEITQLKYPELTDEVSNCEASDLAEVSFIRPFELKTLSRVAYFIILDGEQKKLLVFINGILFESSHALESLLKAINEQQIITPDFLAKFPQDITRDFLTCAWKNNALQLYDKNK